MLTTIESVKRAARKGKQAQLSGLNESDKRRVLKMAGFPTSSGTMYVSGFDGKELYLKYVKL